VAPAVDPHARNRGRGLKGREIRGLGAEAFISTHEPKALRSAAGTLDLILSTVFLSPDWPALLRALRPRGTLEFAAREGIAARVEVRPLAEADAALDVVRRGRARYRVVLAA